MAIKIIATDPSGYKAEDTLTIAVNVTFSYVIELIAIISSPIVKKKDFLYENIYFFLI